MEGVAWRRIMMKSRSPSSLMRSLSAAVMTIWMTRSNRVTNNLDQFPEALEIQTGSENHWRDLRFANKEVILDDFPFLP
ncbi:hypothetical protein L484_003934 [Morus notabilis]|uniref:Uncharacterized protein n=1 Tax=Morus notabilis TaxID=981085 RepID=W9R8W1_9ROSA|nr:hypothetical protein L484_003934 [Morus notabilis]